MKVNKKCFCSNRKETSGAVGVVQKETHYYSFYFNTSQWEDFHGDESIESQSFFCLKCNKKLNSKMVENLMNK